MVSRILPLLVAIFCSVAQFAKAQPEEEPTSSWSVRMAESVMRRSPQLSQRWHYEMGVMLKAFERLWRRTGDDRYFDYIRTNIDSFVGDDGSIRTYAPEEHNLDQINAGKLLFPLYEETHEDRYRVAIELLRGQLRTQPRTSEGGFWHKEIYPYQLWLDGVYMAGPFLARYGVQFDDPQAVDETVHEFLLAARYMRDPATGLFYHGWDEKRTQIWADSLTGRSPNFWGRAIGWYAMAIVDVLDYLPENHEGRPVLVGIFQRLAEALVGVQDPVSGVWYQVLDVPAYEGNYLEASASSMFVYALSKGVRLGYLDSRFAEAARRGYEGILREFITVDDGMVNLNGICSVAGLGGEQQRDGSLAYYVSEPVSSNDAKGVGPFIMASLEFEAMTPR